MTPSSRLLIASLLVLAPAAGLAQDERYPDGRSGIILGWFITDRDTETRFDSDSGRGTDIQMEDDLGLESSMTVGRLGGYFWMKPRHRLDFSVFDLSRTASRRIDETIEFGDETFSINTLITSTFDLTITKIDYTFAPLSRPGGYLGFNAGFYIAATEVSLAASGQNVQATRESEDLTAPLPVFGLRGEFEVTDRITLGGAAQFFKIEIDDTSGSLRDIFIGADYSLGENYAVGLAYNDVSMSIKSEEEGGFRGSLDWGYDGWLIYFKAGFGRNTNL